MAILKSTGTPPRWTLLGSAATTLVEEAAPPRIAGSGLPAPRRDCQPSRDPGVGTQKSFHLQCKGEISAPGITALVHLPRRGELPARDAAARRQLVAFTFEAAGPKGYRPYGSTSPGCTSPVSWARSRPLPHSGYEP
jgi:hypothetical protein